MAPKQQSFTSLEDSVERLQQVESERDLMMMTKEDVCVQVSTTDDEEDEEKEEDEEILESWYQNQSEDGDDGGNSSDGGCCESDASSVLEDQGKVSFRLSAANRRKKSECGNRSGYDGELDCSTTVFSRYEQMTVVSGFGYDPETVCDDDGIFCTSADDCQISFSTSLRVHEIMSRNDYTSKELKACWYTLEDKAKMNARHEKYVARYESGKPSKRSNTYRGLECWTVQGAKDLETTITKTIDAVMDEQDSQWMKFVDDYEQLANVSMFTSEPSKKLAREMAILDEIAAKECYATATMDQDYVTTASGSGGLGVDVSISEFGSERLDENPIPVVATAAAVTTSPTSSKATRGRRKKSSKPKSSSSKSKSSSSKSKSSSSSSKTMSSPTTSASSSNGRTGIDSENTDSPNKSRTSKKGGRKKKNKKRSSRKEDPPGTKTLTTTRKAMAQRQKGMMGSPPSSPSLGTTIKLLPVTSRTA